jgi:hypothetical protein
MNAKIAKESKLTRDPSLASLWVFSQFGFLAILKFLPAAL